MMMEAKEDPEQKKDLFNAVFEGDLSALTRFATKDNVDKRNDQGETLLIVASRWRGAEFVESLIQLGADIEARHSSGKTAICYARSLESLQKLIDHGANIHVQDNDGTTVLMLHCAMGFPKNVDLLIQHGADVNVQDVKGRSAAMFAAECAQTECLELLLKADADVNLIDKKGQTVASFVITCSRGCLELLLKNENVFSNGEFTPRHKDAILKREYLDLEFRDVLKLIGCGMFEWKWLDDSSPLDTIIFPAVYRSVGPGTVKFKDLDVEVSALSKAFFHGDDNCVKFLLAHRFFLPEDYVFLSSKKAFRDQYAIDNTSELLERLTLHPLSLKTWSFLTISKAISLAGPLTKWSERVNALPVPELIKKAFRFESSISDLCFMLWHEISIEEAFESLNFRKEMSSEWSGKSCKEFADGCQKCFPCNSDEDWEPGDGGSSFFF